MKIKSVLILLAIAGFINFSACKEKKSKSDIVDEMVAKSKEKRKAGATASPEVPQSWELKLTKGNLSYASKYEFSLDADKTAQIKAMSPKIIEAGYYRMTMPKSSGFTGLNYQLISGEPNLNGAVDGLLRGYKNIKDVELADGKINDVSDKYGMPSKMGSGKISFPQRDGSVDHGEYYFLAMTTGKELLLFQGLFERIGTADAKRFTDMLENLKYSAVTN